jgi:chemotaxis protein CheC
MYQFRGQKAILPVFSLKRALAHADNSPGIKERTMAVTMQKLSELTMDVLREVGNVGAGNAMTSLATMVDKKVDMSIPRVAIVPLAEFAEMAGGPEALSVGIYMPVEGDAPGHVALIMPEANARRLVDQLMGLPVGTTTELGEIECSALMETGNILASSHLVALCEMTGLNFLSCPPAIAVDMTAAILSAIAVTVAALEDQAITIVTQMVEEEDSMGGYFIYIPELDSLSVILRALNMEE